MRVLHLVHPWFPHAAINPFGSAPAPDALVHACVESIRLSPEHEHRVLLIGPRAAAMRAARLGLRCQDRIGPAFNAPALAASSVRHYLRARPRPDAVQLWGASLGGLAKVALRRLAVHAPCLEVVPSAGTIRADAPAVGRAVARARLGLDEHEPVVGLIGDPPDEADARWIAALLTTLEFAGARAACVLPEGARDLARARRLRRSAGRTFGVAVTGDPPRNWLAACDVAVLPPADTLMSGEGPRGAEVRFAFAAAAAEAAALGVPVVCDALLVPPGLLPDEVRNDCVMKRTLPARAAAQVLALLESPSRRAEVGELMRRGAARADPVQGAAGASAAAWSGARDGAVVAGL